VSGAVYTKEVVMEVAKRYSTVGEFTKEARPHYTAAWRNGWLEEVCAHMTKKTPGPKPRMTRESVVALAGEYATFTEFRKAHRSAFVTAHRKGWGDDVHAVFDNA
jgi:hypothetical protein